MEEIIVLEEKYADCNLMGSPENVFPSQFETWEISAECAAAQDMQKQDGPSG